MTFDIAHTDGRRQLMTWFFTSDVECEHREVLEIAGISSSNLQNWANRRLVTPKNLISPARRFYSAEDVLVITMAAQFIAHGIETNKSFRFARAIFKRAAASECRECRAALRLALAHAAHRNLGFFGRPSFAAAAAQESFESVENDCKECRAALVSDNPTTTVQEITSGIDHRDVVAIVRLGIKTLDFRDATENLRREFETVGSPLADKLVAESRKISHLVSDVTFVDVDIVPRTQVQLDRRGWPDWHTACSVLPLGCIWFDVAQRTYGLKHARVA